MRIDRLLDDLEAARAAAERAEAREELADTVRVERAKVRVEDRLRGAVGTRVTLAVDGGHVAGLLVTVGVGWVALDRQRRDAGPGGDPGLMLDDLARPGIRIVPTPRIAAVTGLPHAHVPDMDSSIGRTWTALLRSLARHRVPLSWHCEGGDAHSGLIEAVGSDHVMLRRQPHDPTLVLLSVDAVCWIDVTAPQG